MRRITKEGVNLEGRLSNSKKGFTLAELLTTIGIISVLTAISSPVYYRARDSARKVHCLGNIRQTAMAMNMYKDDWEGIYPYQRNSREFPVGRGDFSVLDYIAKGYVKNTGIFRCPNDSTAVRGITNSRLGEEDSARASYDTVFSAVCYPISETVIDSPTFPILWDLAGGATPELSGYYPYLRDYVNHENSGGNVAYADSHAKWLPSEKWDNRGRRINISGNNPGGIPRHFLNCTLKLRKII